MIGTKIKGGLDMPDFEIINNALKCIWHENILLLIWKAF